MAGIIIPILPKRRFDFSFLNGSQSRMTVLHSALNLIPFKSARLLLRVHNVDIPGSGSILLATFATAPCVGDTAEFTATAATLSGQVDSSSTNGDLIIDDDSDIPPIMKIVVAGTQDPAGPMALWAELSADLLVRES